MKNLKFLTVVIMILFLSSNVFSQPGGVPDDPSVGGGGSNQNGAVGHPVNAPIDSSYGFVFLLSSLYAIKKLNKKQQEIQMLVV